MNLLEAVRRALSGRPASGNRLREAERLAVSPAVPESMPGPDSRIVGQRPDRRGPASEDVVASRQQRAAERLLEDERLRGSMTDEELEPLFEWALATVDRVAAATAAEASAPADEQIERALAAVRRAFAAVERVLALASEGKGSELRDVAQRLAAVATPPLVLPAEAASRQAWITAELERVFNGETGLGARRDGQPERAALARRLADILSAALRPVDEVLR